MAKEKIRRIRGGETMFLNTIFALFILMIVRTIWLLRKENKSKGGKPIIRKHFNGRFYW